jgi:hypothetical protein
MHVSDMLVGSELFLCVGMLPEEPTPRDLFKTSMIRMVLQNINDSVGGWPLPQAPAKGG